MANEQDDHRSVLSILSSFPDGLPESCLVFILRQILEALCQLHDQEQFHGRIEPANILIDKNGELSLAPGLPPEAAANPPPYWVPPEVLKSEETGEYTMMSDMWGFGITAMELAHGGPPLSLRPHSKSYLSKISRRLNVRFPDYFDKTNKKKRLLSVGFKQMVGLCLDQDPSTRVPPFILLLFPLFDRNEATDALVYKFLRGFPTMEQRIGEGRNEVLESIWKSNGGDDDDDDDDEDGFSMGGWSFNEDEFVLERSDKGKTTVCLKWHDGGSVEEEQGKQASISVKQEVFEYGLQERKMGLLNPVIFEIGFIDGQSRLVWSIIDAFRCLIDTDEVSLSASRLGLYLQVFDAAKKSLAELGFRPDMFDYYRCQEREEWMKIRLSFLLGLLESMGEGMKTIRANRCSHSIVNFVITSHGMIASLYIQLRDDILYFPQAKFPTTITMSSSDLSTVCIFLSNYSTRVYLSVTPEEVKFSAPGYSFEKASIVCRRSRDQPGAILIDTDRPITIGFPAMYLTSFARFASLTKRVKISLSRDKGMLVQYLIGEHVCISYNVLVFWVHE